MEAVTITTALTNWTELVGGVISIVTSNAVLFTGFTIGLVGGAIGLVKRLIP